MNKSKTKIGVVTVLYLGNEVLEDFFSSLSQQDLTADLTVYFIDNSPDDSGSRLAKQLGDNLGIALRFFHDGLNHGVAKGNNIGIRMALEDGCSHVLLANNDIVISKGAIYSLLTSMESGNFAACTSKIYYWGTNLLWYAGGSIRPLLMRTPHFFKLKNDTGQADTPTVVGYAPTCFMLIDASVFSVTGLMDEQYFCYYDDTDFVWRLHQKGYRLFYQPGSVVQHKVSTSTGGDLSPFSLYYMNRNRIYFARKNMRGLTRPIALAYIMLTRIVPFVKLHNQPSLRKRLVDGIKEGWKIEIPSNEISS